MNKPNTPTMVFTAIINPLIKFKEQLKNMNATQTEPDAEKFENSGIVS